MGNFLEAPYLLEAVVVVLGLALLMLEAFLPKADKRLVAYIALIGLAGVLVASFNMKAPENLEHSFWSFYATDNLAFFYKNIAVLATMLVIVMAIEYTPVLEKYVSQGSKQGGLGEFFCLPVFVCAGLMWMASAKEFITIFVSLETVTISFYVLVAYMRRNVGSLEAGVKYLILGALSTGFFVYGVTWVFGLTGETHLEKIGIALQGLEGSDSAVLFAFTLILVGLGFKVAAVPFHVWVPDVYQGAPTPVTAFLSVGSKAAGFIVATRILQPFLEMERLHSSFTTILVIVTGATILFGNFAAIPQTNFKRLLAYSSISHAGFLLLALTCTPDQFQLTPGQVVAFYLATYLLMTMLCFLVLTIVRRSTESDEIAAFSGLHRRSPFLAFALLIGVISLAGVPLTAGFLGKFFVFTLAIDSGRWILLAFAVVGAASGFYYYLKVARAMYWEEPTELAAIEISPLARLALLLLIIATIVFGVYPAPILGLLTN
ncbi:MAG: NADH-quinone oxidoreductase subunit N [Verrucomicrobiales bacterium]